MATNDLPSTTRAPELDDRNAVIVLKAETDRWTGIDESAEEGISRETVGHFLSQGRELQAIGVNIAQAQAQWGVGGRGGATK
ncbi:large subunit of alpha-aminoadipate reductase [Metarhizium acridum]|nr:large subunit of alpha-aminoadipate reductase [Metarhizium acridum]